MPCYSKTEISMLTVCFGTMIHICSVYDDIEIYLSCLWDGSLSDKDVYGLITGIDNGFLWV